MNPYIQIIWGRHVSDLFYGPKCFNFKNFDAALTWAKEYKEISEKARPGVIARLFHYPTGRKNEKPIPLEDINDV